MTQDNKNDRSTSTTLLALTSAALALPGIAGKAEAQTPVVQPELRYQASFYREADIPAGKLQGGSDSRYEIDTHLLQFVTPVSRRNDIAVDLTYESMSGASPWFILPGNNDKPMQVMSGATIEETRRDIQVKGSHHRDNDISVTGIVGFSEEDDYHAINGGVEMAVELTERQLTLSGGLGYSDHQLRPTDGHVMADRIRRASKGNFTTFISASQVYSPRTAAQVSIGYSRFDGFLSDPYKKAWIVSLNNVVADRRPSKREQFTLATRLRHFVPAARAALHLDYRFFSDNWRVDSHTVDLGWYQNLPAGWQLAPSLRYYTQTQAYFYAPFYHSPRRDGLASSDYRLSPYGALSLRLRASKQWTDVTAFAEWEGYRASGSLSLRDVEVENPGLVEFNIFSLGISKRF